MSHSLDDDYPIGFHDPQSSFKDELFHGNYHHYDSDSLGLNSFQPMPDTEDHHIASVNQKTTFTAGTFDVPYTYSMHEPLVDLNAVPPVPPLVTTAAVQAPPTKRLREGEVALRMKPISIRALTSNEVFSDSDDEGDSDGNRLSSSSSTTLVSASRARNATASRTLSEPLKLGATHSKRYPMLKRTMKKITSAKSNQLQIPLGLLSLLGEPMDQPISSEGSNQWSRSFNVDFASIEYKHMFIWLSSRYVEGSTASLREAILFCFKELAAKAQANREYLACVVGLFVERFKLLAVYWARKSGGFEEFLKAERLDGDSNITLISNLPPLIMRSGLQCHKRCRIDPDIITMIRKTLPEGGRMRLIDEDHIAQYVRFGFIYHVSLRALEFMKTLVKLGVADDLPEGLIENGTEAIKNLGSRLARTLKAVPGLKIARRFQGGGPGPRSQQRASSSSSSPSPVKQKGDDKSSMAMVLADDDDSEEIITDMGAVSKFNVRGRQRDSPFVESSGAMHGLATFCAMAEPVESFRICACLMSSKYTGPEFSKTLAFEYRWTFRQMLIESLSYLMTEPYETIPKTLFKKIGENLMNGVFEYHELMPLDLCDTAEAVIADHKILSPTIECVKDMGIVLLKTAIKISSGKRKGQPQVKGEPKDYGTPASTPSTPFSPSVMDDEDEDEEDQKVDVVLPSGTVTMSKDPRLSKQEMSVDEDEDEMMQTPDDE